MAHFTETHVPHSLLSRLLLWLVSICPPNATFTQLGVWEVAESRLYDVGIKLCDSGLKCVMLGLRKHAQVVSDTPQKVYSLQGI